MVAIYVISVLLSIGTLLPLNSSKYWFIRDQMMFRGYYLIFHTFLFLLYSLSEDNMLIKCVGCAIHLIGILICYNSIQPYLFFSKQSVPDAESTDKGIVLKLLIFNVLYSNDNYDKFLSLVEKENPDIILLLEPGQSWYEGVQSIHTEYPHIVKELREDTYGIMMMSRIAYLENQINHLIEKDNPSIEVKIKLGNKIVKIFGLHPKPALPQENLTTLEKDIELLKTSIKIEQQPKEWSTITIGDLNDVGWSRITKQFKRIAGMYDPREGRGFFATFPTYFPIRIPIDHVFCSQDVRLIDFNRKENIGSDHYPVCVTFLVPEV